MADDVDTARALIDTARRQVLDARRRIVLEMSLNGMVSDAAWACNRAAELALLAADATHLRLILEQPLPRITPANRPRLVPI